MSAPDEDRTASLMTPARLAQLQVRPRPAADPAAYLDALAADAGSGHVRRLADLRRQLEAQVRDRDYVPAAGAIDALAGALGKLDFSVLQPRGWLARATGKGKEAGAGFAAQVNRIDKAADDLADEGRDLQKKLQALAAPADRGVLEVEVEQRAIEKIMDQGARWLQDMRNQLKVRQAEASDAAAQQQIEDDNTRCELLVVRLKQLRAVVGATQQVVERCRSLASARTAFANGLKAMQEGPLATWSQRSASVAEEARTSGAASDGAEAARSAQQELQSALQRAAQDCAALQSQEQALAADLQALQEPLQAAA